MKRIHNTRLTERRARQLAAERNALKARLAYEETMVCKIAVKINGRPYTEWLMDCSRLHTHQGGGLYPDAWVVGGTLTLDLPVIIDVAPSP